MKRTPEDIKRTMETSRYAMSTFISREARNVQMMEDIRILLSEIERLKSKPNA